MTCTLALFALPVMNMLIRLLFSCRSNSFMAVLICIHNTPARRKRNGEKDETSHGHESDANPILSARPSTARYSICDRSREMDQSVSFDAAPAPGWPQTLIHRSDSNVRHCRTPRLSCSGSEKWPPQGAGRCVRTLRAIKAVSTQFALIGPITRPEPSSRLRRQIVTRSFFHLRTEAH